MRAVDLTGKTINGVFVLEKLPKRGHISYYRTLRVCGHEVAESGSSIGTRPKCRACAAIGRVPPNKLPDTLTDADVADYIGNRTSALTLAKQRGHSDAGIVCRWLRHRGVAVSPRRPGLRLRVIAALKAGQTGETRRQAIALRFAAGESAEQIGDDLGITKARVCQLLHDFLGD